MANDMVFHAAALTCAYLTFREDKRFLRKNPDFFRDLASKVVLATLSAPHTHHRDLNFRFVETEENFYENEKQLSSYLYLSYIPTRNSLLSQIQVNSILENIPNEVKILYKLMTSAPLIHLEQKEFSEILIFIKKNQSLSIYIPYLKMTFAIELIVTISKYYGNISFSRLHETINFLNKDEIETCLIIIFKYLHYHVKMDHNTYCVKFPHSISIPISAVNSNRENHFESDLKLSQLKHIHSLLSKCIINSNNNQLIQSYEGIKNNSKGVFLSVEKDLNKIFTKRRNDLENLQSQLEQRKKTLSFKFQNDSPTYAKVDAPTQGNLTNSEKPTETLENNPRDFTNDNALKEEYLEKKNLSVIDKAHAVVGRPKLEEKPKDPNRYRQNEKSLDFIFRAQRQKEISVLSLGQKDRTHVLSQKWCISERNRVRIARDSHTEKIVLRDRFNNISYYICSLKDEIMNTRLKSSQESINLLNLFENATQILLDESKKNRRLKQKQTNRRNHTKNQYKTIQNRPHEIVNTPRGYKNLQPESNPPQQGNKDNTKSENTGASPAVYVPPHLKNRGKHS